MNPLVEFGFNGLADSISFNFVHCCSGRSVDWTLDTKRLGLQREGGLDWHRLTDDLTNYKKKERESKNKREESRWRKRCMLTRISRILARGRRSASGKQ